MKKILVIFAFFAVFSAIKLVSANSVFATISLEGWLNNKASTVGVEVTITYSKNGASGFLQVAHWVNAGDRLFVQDSTDTADSPPYSMTWSTGCGNLGSANLSSLASPYGFIEQDVHCTGTNSTVTITDTSCPQVGSDFNGHVGWQVSNVANANISYFEVYKAKGADPDTDTNPATVNFVAGQAPYSSDMPALPDPIGTWNVRVKAYPPSTNTGISVNNNYFTCGVVGAPGGSVVPPTVLTAFATGCGTTNTVTFTWVAATPGTFNYRVYIYSDPAGTTSVFPYSWSPNPATNAYTSTTNWFTNGTTYYWRVKATPSPVTGQQYWSSTPLPSFTVPTGTCVSGSVTPPKIGDVRACYNMNISPYSGDPDKVNVSWISASGTGLSIVPGQEFVDWSQDSSFMPANYQTAASGPGYTIGESPTYAFMDNQTYYFRIRTQMNDTNWYFSQIVAVVIPGNCNSASTLNVTGFVECENTIPFFHMRWNKLDNDSDNKFILQSYQGAGTGWQPTNWSTASTTFYGGGMLLLYDTWRVIGRIDTPTTNGTTIYSNQLIFSNPCASMPGAVDTMSVSSTCDINNNPIMNFSFKDQSGSESSFFLEVSSDPFIGPSDTKLYDKWGTKVITRTDAEKTATGGVVNFSWSNSTITNTSGRLEVGDANPHTDLGTGNDGPANNLIPLNATGYWWRVRAVNYSGSSAYNYNDGSVLGTPNPSGIPFQSSRCRGLYDLSPAFDGNSGGSWKNSQGQTTQNFTANETVTVDVLVTNNNLTNSDANSYQTKLYFYYKGGATPACSDTSGTLSPNIPADGDTIAHQPPPNSGDQSYIVPGIPKGGSATIHVTFNVGSDTESFTALAYVVPTCNFPGDPANGTDMIWSNNLTATGFTYTVGVDKFFETRGGDVGAVNTLSVGADSSNIPPVSGGAKFQSQYLLAAGSVSSTAKTAAGGFRIAPYNKSGQLVSSSGVAGSGVYKYFADKFRSKANQNTEQCTISNGTVYNANNKLYFCGKTSPTQGDVTISSDTTLGAGTNAVFFIDGNLNINAKLMLPAGTNDTAVYIVQGDIKVDASVTQIDGVFITGKSFSDCSGNACAVGDLGNLTINGSVYADGEGNVSLELGRYFSTISKNANTPAEIVKFEPKYLIALSTVLAGVEVGWKEVNP